MKEIAYTRKSALCRYIHTSKDFHWQKVINYFFDKIWAQSVSLAALAAHAAASSALTPQGAGSEWTIWKFSNASRKIRNISVYVTKDYVGNRALLHIHVSK